MASTKTKKEIKKPRVKEKNFFRVSEGFIARRFKASYFTINWLPFGLVGVLLVGFLLGRMSSKIFSNALVLSDQNDSRQEYWLKLHRKSEREYLYFGTPGQKDKSRLVRTFIVKTGIPGQRPTPLPQALGKKYWKIVKKYASHDNPETAPYFLELDIPVEDGFFGPVPYKECNNSQCSWELPGYFGLHGVNGDDTRLSDENPGSSGCIRHSDNDITYLYNLLEVDEGVRYYVTDS